MQVLKFGGSSLVDAKCFEQVANIVERLSQQSQLAVVLSAPQGLTNNLLALVDSLADSSQSQKRLDIINRKLYAILDDAFSNATPNQQGAVKLAVEEITLRLAQLVEGARLLEHCPPSTAAQILTSGEKFSVALLGGYLSARGQLISHIDPEEFLIIDDRSTEPVADLLLCKQKFRQAYPTLNPISLMPGFYGVNSSGAVTTLGRNGSDYSAAVVAVCLQATSCEIWTDVDGVYNADPRVVKDAELIESMSYHEAMELSYFGAKVLHPKTIAPLSLYDIPCRIKNTHAPHKPGTLISKETSPENRVKAISNLSDVAMINVSGPGMKGMVGMAARVFSAISQANISVIMISQSSAEYCISFCVPGGQADAAIHCLQQAFELELHNELLEPISVKRNLAIVTLVGDQMRQQTGIAANFFKALSQVRVNIIAIAQDSSERSISAVIRDQRIDEAVKVCHQNLFLKKPRIDAIIIGCGTIGGELISQIQKQQSRLFKKNIVINLVGIANSKHILLDKEGINLNCWQQSLADASQSFSLQLLIEFAAEAHLSTPVIIDCTSSHDIAMQYIDILDNGFHLVTANKKANTADFDYYQKLHRMAEEKQRRFLYETNVGAGLPVIDNLQGLLRAGDFLIQFEGILSGSLSYIFGEIHHGLTLSQATQKACQLGYTEPNPAEDLSGLDVARKVLVIAREAGLKLELSDIKLESVVPDNLAKLTDAKAFLEQLPSYDKAFDARIKEAEQKNQLLRYIARIENNRCEVSIQSVDSNHPLYGVANGENALAIITHYYQPMPFVIRGYGAGAAVTAAGLFGDILRTLAWDHEQ